MQEIIFCRFTNPWRADNITTVRDGRSSYKRNFGGNAKGVISMTVFAEMFIAAGSLVFAFVMEMRDICAEMAGAKHAGAAAKRF